MNKNIKTLGFRYGLFPPDYISKEELLAASRDCLSHQIIETDRTKLLRILSKLDARGVENTIIENTSWTKLEEQVFGFLIYNEGKFETEILLFLKNDIPEEISQDIDVILIEFMEEGADYSVAAVGDIINIEPLMIMYELGNVWGYVQTKNGIEDVEICAITEDLYDWKPNEEFSEKPFIRNPEEEVKQSTREPKRTTTPQQREAKKAELDRLIMKGIREMSPETLANKQA